MLRKFRMNFSAKIVAYLVIVSLLSVIMSGVVYNIVFSVHLHNNYYETVDDVAKYAFSNLGSRIDDVERIAESFVYNKSFYAMLKKEYVDIERLNVLNDYLLPLGASVLKFQKFDIRARAFICNKTIPEYYYSDGSVRGMTVKNTLEIRHIDYLFNDKEYMEFYNGASHSGWFQIGDDIKNGDISFLCKLIDYPNIESYGMLQITVNIEQLFSGLLLGDFAQEYSYEIKDEQQSLLFTEGAIADSKQEIIGITKEIEGGVFKFNLSMPLSNINKGMNVVTFVIFSVALISMILILIMGIFLKNKLQSYVQHILEGISHIENGEYEYRIEDINVDEFDRISHSLNSLAQTNNHLINDVYEAMIRNQELEMQMLQAKIDPHFLYNVFNIISTMASCGKNAEIIEIVRNVASFYRSILSKNAISNNISTELECLEKYLKIIDIQREGSVNTEYKIDSECLECLVPNFILQPIVENCIKHAIVDNHIDIVIEVKLVDSDVRISVRDNGVGMSEEQIEKLFEFKSGSGYGLYNINERLLLRYGKERYSLKCKSEGYMKGTEVCFFVPYETESEELF